MPRKSTGKAQAGSAKRYCMMAPRVVRALSDDVSSDPRRAHAVLTSSLKWANHTVLHYCFFTHGKYTVPKAQAEVIRQAFATWKDVGIGLDFVEVKQLSEAEVRIGYSTAEGASQSSVGREVLDVRQPQPTTQYGWDLRTDFATALHEIGHVIGMEHEHQNPRAGITWHEQAVYDYFAGDPNYWNHDDTFHNVIEPLRSEQVQGSKWDPRSIMEYDFAPHLIDVPDKYDRLGLETPGAISKLDQQWARRWYPNVTRKPKPLEPFASIALALDAGEQADFVIKPTESRRYTMTTQGASDTLIALFEDIDGTPRYLTADDDSGAPRTATIVYKLFKGRKYYLRVRLVYPGATGTTSVMYY